MFKRQSSSSRVDERGAEHWRPVPSEPDLLASTWGRVLQQPRYAPMKRGGYRIYTPVPRFGQVSRSKTDANHEFMIIMVYDRVKKQRPRKVHQLVCEAFHGPKPFPKAVVIHGDENSINNRPENLRWGTQKENMNMPKFKEYLCSRTGEKNPAVKGRKAAQVRAALRACAQGGKP